MKKATNMKEEMESGSLRKKIDINLEEMWLDRDWKIFKIDKKREKEIAQI